MKMNRYICIAGLTTAKAVAAISSIQIVGTGAADILKTVFKPVGRGKVDFSKGQILHGFIFDSDKDIDEVIIGCEETDSFSINCHGNPLIVENILELLAKKGAKITTPQEILVHLSGQKHGDDTIAAEADLAIAQSATLDGARIIAHQTKMGLLQTAGWWIKNLDVLELDDIKKGAERILTDSDIADLFIKGVKIVLAGPPNSGKSTLFNYLCGREKAIVTDIAGTTRDWLSAHIRLKKIQAEFFDTAGLDEVLSGQNKIDADAQVQAKELIEKADLVLYVVDCTNPAIVMAGLTESLNEIVVLNKCDLGKSTSAEGIEISAKTAQGVDKLLTAIEAKLGVSDFDMKKTVCFTLRQRKLLQQIAEAKSKQQVRELIQELLKSNIIV
ncbi:MAG: 50S ribosome-binding GTPase [Sedimentisphaerales bacterium]|nr:50S ribosome-binding GTPase [Sedimentisphaerales bacterium]